MRLNAGVFEVAAQRHVLAAVVSMTVAIEAGSGPVASAFTDVAEACLGWASASAAVSRLYRRRSHAAALSG